jgi:hypothetical protein
MGKWTEQTIFKWRSTNGKEMHVEMLTILGYKENAN